MDTNQDTYNPRAPEQRYDPEGIDERAQTVLSRPEESDGPRPGAFHAARLGKMAVLFSVMVVVGGFAAVVMNQTATTGTRASIDNLYGPETISAEERTATETITEYPTGYKGRPIPATIVEDGTRKYLALPEAERKAYIINRIVLYYVYDDVIKTNNIPYTKPVEEISFELIEQQLPEMRTILKGEYPDPDIFTRQYLDRFEY
jgi:hypothetical protein